MIPVPSGARVWLAAGHTDMSKGFDGLALLVQEALRRDPHNEHLFVFRGRRGGLIKVLWHDGQGMCLFAKRLERGQFLWPSPARCNPGCQQRVLFFRICAIECEGYEYRHKGAVVICRVTSPVVVD